MEDNLSIIQGDALTELRKLPAESVQCCVTSPPYWGLRDYSTNGQLGLEKTPEEYVTKMVEIFREVRRVLRKDGTLWLNMGDNYATTPTGNRGTKSALHGAQTSEQYQDTLDRYTDAKLNRAPIPDGLKPKDLVGIPWMLAFALRADGWWLRSDIIWAKPNPMPESVTDRPTKAHEYLFLLTKSASYYYDSEAIREPHSEPWRGNGEKERGDTQRDPLVNYNARSLGVREYNLAGRNKRSVWTVATQAYAGAHFATFPEDLIKPCIMAGTSAKGCCAKCGAPWERVVERPTAPSEVFTNVRIPDDKLVNSGFCKEGGVRRGSGSKYQNWLNENPAQTLGWQPTCKCDAGLEPCVCLDPFAGSGTTGAVALELGRKAVLIELNPHYVALIEQRCNVTLGLALA